MSAHEKPSVSYQDGIYDQPVVYYGEDYLANSSVAGVYHSMGVVAGHHLLDHCGNCSGPSEDGCYASELGEPSYILEREQFIVQAG